MPLGKGVGKVNRGGKEKLDDGRTSPLVWIEASLSPLESVCSGGVGSHEALEHITTTHLPIEMELKVTPLPVLASELTIRVAPENEITFCTAQV